MAWSFCRRCSSAQKLLVTSSSKEITRFNPYYITTACVATFYTFRGNEKKREFSDTRCDVFTCNTRWSQWLTYGQHYFNPNRMIYKTFCSRFPDKEKHKRDKKTKILDKIERIKEVKEDIMTVPNLLSSLRILASPLLGYLVIQEQFLGAVILFGFAGISDLLDGYIARNFKNQKSVLGTVLDPMADKLLISILTVSLSVASLLPVPLTVLILGRDLGLILCSMYLRYKSLPQPKTLSRYFDVNLPSVEFRPTLISKVNTALQLGLVGCSLAAPVFDVVNHPFLQVSWYVVGCTTFLSGFSYVFSKSAIKFVETKERVTNS